jgi:hypothetical protein
VPQLEVTVAGTPNCIIHAATNVRSGGRDLGGELLLVSVKTGLWP